MEVEVDDVSSSDIELLLSLGCATGAAVATDSMKPEPSASNPKPPEPSLTLGLSDAAGAGQQDRALSASFSNVKESDPGFEEAEKLSARGSDIDEEEGGGGSRKKLRLTKEQSALLEYRFKEHSTLNPKQKAALAKELKLRPRQVEVWFQNRRARTKLKQTEVDCDFLRRCCEALRDENRRLSKELKELKALKGPLYMRFPAAAALTVCPSCERVAAGGPGNGSKAAAAFAAGSEKALFLTPFNHSAAC